jgi:hypothetical protein
MFDTESNPRKVRTVVMLDPAEREALEQLSDATDAPVSALLRRATRQLLEQQKPDGGSD